MSHPDLTRRIAGGRGAVAAVVCLALFLAASGSWAAELILSPGVSLGVQALVVKVEDTRYRTTEPSDLSVGLEPGVTLSYKERNWSADVGYTARLRLRSLEYFGWSSEHRGALGFGYRRGRTWGIGASFGVSYLLPDQVLGAPLMQPLGRETGSTSPVGPLPNEELNAPGGMPATMNPDTGRLEMVSTVGWAMALGERTALAIPVKLQSFFYFPAEGESTGHHMLETLAVLGYASSLRTSWRGVLGYTVFIGDPSTHLPLAGPGYSYRMGASLQLRVRLLLGVFLGEIEVGDRRVRPEIPLTGNALVRLRYRSGRWRLVTTLRSGAGTGDPPGTVVLSHNLDLGASYDIRRNLRLQAGLGASWSDPVVEVADSPVPPYRGVSLGGGVGLRWRFTRRWTASVGYSISLLYRFDPGKLSDYRNDLRHSAGVWVGYGTKVPLLAR